MADDEVDAVAEEIVGDRNALARIGGVVADDQLDLLAVDAAGGIDVGDGLLDAVLELCAERCVRAGHRPRDAQFELLRSAVTAGEHGDGRERQRGKDGG